MHQKKARKRQKNKEKYRNTPGSRDWFLFSFHMFIYIFLFHTIPKNKKTSLACNVFLGRPGSAAVTVPRSWEPLGRRLQVLDGRLFWFFCWLVRSKSLQQRPQPDVLSFFLFLIICSFLWISRCLCWLPLKSTVTVTNQSQTDGYSQTTLSACNQTATDQMGKDFDGFCVLLLFFVALVEFGFGCLGGIG